MVACMQDCLWPHARAHSRELRKLARMRDACWVVRPPTWHVGRCRCPPTCAAPVTEPPLRCPPARPHGPPVLFDPSPALTARAPAGRLPRAAGRQAAATAAPSPPAAVIQLQHACSNVRPHEPIIGGTACCAVLRGHPACLPFSLSRCRARWARSIISVACVWSQHVPLDLVGVIISWWWCYLKLLYYHYLRYTPFISFKKYSVSFSKLSNNSKSDQTYKKILTYSCVLDSL